MRGLLQISLDVVEHIKWLDLRGVIPDNVTCLAYQEFSKVPAYLISVKGAVRAKELIDGMSVFTINVNFAEHWEFNAIRFRGKSLYFGISPGFLSSKLVRWEGKNFKALVFIVETDKLLIVRVGVLSATRNIDNK